MSIKNTISQKKKIKGIIIRGEEGYFFLVSLLSMKYIPQNIQLFPLQSFLLVTYVNTLLKILIIYRLTPYVVFKYWAKKIPGIFKKEKKIMQFKLNKTNCLPVGKPGDIKSYTEIYAFQSHVKCIFAKINNCNQFIKTSDILLV